MSTPALNPSRAYHYGAFVESSYLMFGSNPSSLTPPITPAALFPAGYRLLFYLTAKDSFADVSEPEFYGFVAQSIATPVETVITIRGTDKFIEWLIDAEFVPRSFAPVPAAGDVEDGFCSVYESLAGLQPDGRTPQDLHAFIRSLAPGSSLVITGHSLGAAVANLLALDATVNDGATALTLYTFAAPMTGGAKFATCFNQNVPVSYRLFNEPDMVPKVPPLYAQVETGFAIDSRTFPQVKHSIVCYHSLATYLYVLNQQSSFSLGDCASGAQAVS